MANRSLDAPLKIADFGFAIRVEKGMKVKEVCGSPGYVAPEVLSESGYGLEADMWSIGVILYILCGFVSHPSDAAASRGFLLLSAIPMTSPSGLRRKENMNCALCSTLVPLGGTWW
jgi:serine/threonine protein kinase